MTTGRPTRSAAVRARRAIAALSVALMVSEVAGAQTCESTDLSATGAHFAAVLQCARARLAGDEACDEPPLPPCGTAVGPKLSDTVRTNSVDALPENLSPGEKTCIDAVLAATQSFVARRFADLAARRRGTPSVEAFARLPEPCGGISGSVEGLRTILGPRCQPAIGPGDAIDPPGLARCLRSGIEAAASTIAPVRPNFILVVTDDQRWDTLEFMPKTMDRLANRGLLFHNAFATTAQCSPSRVSILTGRYAHGHGMTKNLVTDDVARMETIGSDLADAGYRTAFFGKFVNNAATVFSDHGPRGWHDWRVFGLPGGSYWNYELVGDGGSTRRGEDPLDYSTDVLSGFATAFVRENAGAPFLLVVAPFAPHATAQPAPRHRGRLSQLPPFRPPSFHPRAVPDKLPTLNFMAVSAWRARKRSPEAYARKLYTHDLERQHELESLLAVDDMVERLSEELDAAGLTDNTVFLLTSDHGVHWGEHGWSSKFTPYEEAIRIPLVVRYPLLVPWRGTRASIALNIDIAPTTTELARAPDLPDVDGKSLVPLFLRDEPIRDQFLIENFNPGSRGGLIPLPNFGARTDRWKYIEAALPQGGLHVELYDLRSDPAEMKNLADVEEFREVRERLARQLASWRTKSAGAGTATPRPTPEP